MNTAHLSNSTPNDRTTATNGTPLPLLSQIATDVTQDHGNREQRERVDPSNLGPINLGPVSPGPVSEAGKANSSRNALTHGLTATKPENAVDPALKPQYEALRNEYLETYQPAGAIEDTLLDMIVLSVWQLYKVQQMELFTELDFGFDGSSGRSEKLARYRASHERALHKNLNQLKQIQQERLFKETDRDAKLPDQIPPGVKVRPLLQHLKTLQKNPKTQTAAATHNSSRRPTPLHRKNRPFPRS